MSLPKQPPQLSTPPGSPTKAPPGSAIGRRKNLRESEDSAGELSLEVFLYRTDPYRSYSSKTPLPTPLRLHNINPIMQDRLRREPGINQNIRHILDEYGIGDQGGYVFCDQSKPGYPGGDIGISTLRVMVDVKDDMPTSGWSKARRALTRMLYERGFETIDVEILDPARSNILRLFPIPPDHPVISTYESFRPKFIEEVMRSLGNNWTTLCLFSVRLTFQNPTFAVVISLQPNTVCDWSILRFRLQQIIRLEFQNQHIAQPSSSIDIEFVPGGWSILDPHSEKPGRSFANEVSQHPKLGTSIGVGGERGGGTFGGFFRLRCGSTHHRGFLTNYHSVAPSESAPKSVKDRSYNEGTSKI